MKKNSIFATVTSAAAAMTLSFGLLACGDDSSSTSSEPVSGGNGSAAQDSSLLVKDSNLECIYENDEMPAADASSETDVVNALRPVATIYEPDEDGFAFVDMGYVSEFPCGSHYENLKASVSGDTLFVSGEFVDSYFDCICPMNVSFKVQNNSSFEKVSWISFNDRSFLPLVKENGVGGHSSSSEELSSSSVSSSSQEETVQQINDIFGTCLDKKVDPMLDATLPPVAYLGYEDGDDSATVVVENVSMNCRSISGTKSIIRQPIVGNIYLSASGDTLYMQQAALDTVNAEPDCIPA